MEAGKRQHRRNLPHGTREAWQRRGEAQVLTLALRNWLLDVPSCGHNVRSTMFIEARAMYCADGPQELRPVGEVEFVQGLAAASASGRDGPCRAIPGHNILSAGAELIDCTRQASFR